MTTELTEAEPPTELDVVALGRAVQIIIAHRRITQAQVAREAGVTVDLIKRVLRSPEIKPSTDNAIALLTWIGEPVRYYRRPRAAALAAAEPAA